MVVKLIDSHCHLGAFPISNLIAKILLVASTLCEWDKIKEIAKENPAILPAYGIHPWYINNPLHNLTEEMLVSSLQCLLEENHCALVGEIGLDSTDKFLPFLAQQEIIFASQFNLACQFKRPVSLHLVGSESVTNLCRFLSKRPNTRPPSAAIHSYTGSLTDLRRLFLAFGPGTSLFIGISKKLSGKLSAKKLNRLLRAVPLNQILIESDHTYSDHIVHVEDLSWSVRLIASHYNLDPEEASLTLCNNFTNFINNGILE